MISTAALIGLIPPQYLEAFFGAIKAGIADAIGAIFWLSVVASLVAFVAAALIEDGHLVAAAQEERFTRKKHDAGFPQNAVQYCLDEAGTTLADIDYVAVQYGNGVWDQLPVRERFAPGSESRWIDLRGEARCVEKISIIGDSDGAPGQARVRVWGRR